MSEAVVVALITGGLALCGTLGGSYLANRKTAALISYRLDKLEEKVDGIPTRVEMLEQRMDETDQLNEEKNKVQNHRIDDLEREVERYHHHA